MARYLDVDQSLISKIEGGDRGYSISMIEKLAVLYCVPVMDILNGTVVSNKKMAFRTTNIDFDDICDLAVVNRIIVNQIEMDRMVDDEG